MGKNCFQSGMSLLEVMISGAMLAGLALVGAELFKGQSSAIKDVIDRSELDNYHNMISAVISDARNCNANLANSIGFPTVSLSNTQFLKCCPNQVSNPNCTLAADSCLGGTSIQNTDVQTLAPFVPTGTDPPPGTKGGFTLRGAELLNAAESGSVTAPSGTGVVKAILLVEYRLLHREMNSGINAGIVKRKIPLYLKFSPDKFIGCVDGESGSKNTLQQELCRTFGDQADYDPETDKCKLNSLSTSDCYPLISAGFDTNGNPVCSFADLIDSNGSTNCQNASSVGFVYNAITNTIRVQCTP
jgi:hypothetical protein